MPYKWEAYCSTNGRRTSGFPFLRSLKARKVRRYKWGAGRTAVQIGDVLPYFLDKCRGWGFPKHCPGKSTRKIHPRYNSSSEEVFLNNSFWVAHSCDRGAGRSSCELFNEARVNAVIFGFFSGFGVGRTELDAMYNHHKQCCRYGQHLSCICRHKSGCTQILTLPSVALKLASGDFNLLSYFEIPIAWYKALIPGFPRKSIRKGASIGNPIP